jgi:4-amino-4-deoxy-L-arabinose transferase-like glycosyltransferase
MRRSVTAGNPIARPAVRELPLRAAPSRRVDGAPGVALALGKFVARRYRLCGLLVLSLMACNVFLGLGSSSINDFDEARYGVSAFEMQQHHAWLVPTYAGETERLALKPPLGYWLMALSFSLFGGSALAMRLPSALCALATVAVTMWWARRWFNRRVAIFAGLILATAFGYLSHHGARSGDFDACLTLILLLVAVRLPALALAPWSAVPIAALLACGFLLKSFAIVPMVLVAGAYLVWTGAWRRQRLVPWLAALGLFGVIVGTWAAARWRADGSPDFLLRMVREDVVGRSTAIVDKSTSSPLGYVTALFDRFAPWPLVIVAAAGVILWTGRVDHRGHRGLRGLRVFQGRRFFQGRRGRFRRGKATALLLLWAGVPLAIVSAVRTQHHWYLDPTYPALAMLAAAGAVWLVRRSPGRLRTVAVAGLVALPLLLCESRLLGRLLVREPMSADQRFLRALRPLAASGCRDVRSTFVLAYSERFILEVEDGFEVVEPAGAWPPGARSPGTWSAGAGAAPAGAEPESGRQARGRPDAASCTLVGKRPWQRPPVPTGERLPAADRLLAESPSYALYRAAGNRALP